MSLQSVPLHEPLLLRPVVRLARALRDAGLSISNSELIDGMRAVGQIDIADRDAVRMALATTLVKQAEDLGTFELLFDLHLPVRSFADARLVGQAERPRPGGARLVSTSLDRLAQDGEDGSGDLLEAIMDALRSGDPEALRALASMAVGRFAGMEGQPNASERYFLYRVLRALELSKLMAAALAAERTAAGADGHDEATVREELRGRIEGFKRLLAGQVRSQLTEQRGADRTGQGLELLGTQNTDLLR